MALIAEIIDSWKSPARGVRRHLARPRSEAFLFTFLFVFLLVTHIAQWPLAARESHLHPEVPLLQRLFAAALAVLGSIPVWYLLAALSRLVAKVLGGQGDWYGARLALFWALATVSPLMLLHGLVTGLLGPGLQATVVGVALGLAFLWLWISMLREAETGQQPWKP